MSADTTTAISATQTIGIIGVGNMGGAVARALITAGVPSAQLLLANSSAESSSRAAAQYGGTAATVAQAASADIVFLGVKPYQITALIQSQTFLADALLISLAAGVTLASLESAAPGQPIIRAMPNTPMMVGKGAISLTPGTHATAAQVQQIEALLSSAGLVFTVPEKQIDAVIGVSGSGPAYVYYLIDAMAEGGVREGLPRAQALQLAQQTFLGAAALLQETGTHPVIAREAVTSPGGTTAEALAALDAHGARAAMLAAVRAAAQRNRELS